MRALGGGLLVLSLSFVSLPASAQSASPSEPAVPVAPAPPADPVPPPPAPEPPTPEPPPPAPSSTTIEPAAPPPTPVGNPTTVPTTQESVAPLDEKRPATTLAATAREAPAAPEVRRFDVDYEALPLTLEARFGFNARLGSSFDNTSDDEQVDTAYAIGAYLAWKPEYALGLELEHTGLGRVRALSGENSSDTEYSSTSAWLAARVFPWRSERLDLFVDLRLGLAMQHVDALGTRETSTSITEPATSFSCSEWDGPGIALGAALGLNLRISRHVAFVTRLDAAGERLNGDVIGTCADGIGTTTSLAGSVGLSYTIETAKH